MDLNKIAKNIVADDIGAELLEALFESRDLAHYWHLQTDSFALHKALNFYYDEILKLTDNFLESYQGLYGRITGEIEIELEDLEPEGVETHLNDLREELAEYYDDLPPELRNIIDEIMALIDKTLYLLSLK